VRINKWLDLLDRVAWTFIQGLAGTLTADALWDADLTWGAKIGIPLTAAFLSAVKTTVAQRTGDDDLGAAVPGNVIQKP
jgi:hypothetical protein